MKATVDGSVRECDLSVQASIQSNVLAMGGRWGGSGGGYTFAINGYDGGTGTYSFGGSNTNLATVSLGTAATDSYVASMVGGSGSLVITSNSGSVIKGTFEFTGQNTDGATKAVTNGSFEIKY